MINVSDECKEAFLSAQQKNLVLTFDDGTVIDNDDIAIESMNIEQYLCSTDELRFGEISSAKFKTKIKASTKRYKDLWFNASITADKNTVKLGRFKVYTDNMTSDNLYREIVAYDALYWAMNQTVDTWFNGLAFPITQKAFRNSFFAHIGIEQESVELPNDNVSFSKSISAENLTGLTIMQKLCEINAAWGVINADGRFKYVNMRTHEHDALYPSDTLYPSDSLFPNDIYDDRLTKANYFQGTLKYEEYDTRPITKVTIREDAEDLGYSYGTEGNTYVIQNNFLLYGASDAVLDTVAKNFYARAKYIAYTPSELKCKGAPWREVGDLLSVVADKRTFTMPILNRSLSGICAMKDTYVAKGKEVYGSNANSSYEKMEQLVSRTNKLTRTLDETKSELQTFETDTNGKLTTMNSTISQTATQVSSKVEKGEVISEINQTAGTIEFKANRKITVDSPNWKVDSNGSQTCSSMNITGGSVSIDNGSNANLSSVTVKATNKGFYSEMMANGFSAKDLNGNYTDVWCGGFAIGHTQDNTPIMDMHMNKEELWIPNVVVHEDLMVDGATYLSSSPIIGSDRDLKEEIAELDAQKTSNFIYSLKPCEYKYKKGTSGRFHHGFIAQEVKESMNEEDWGVYVDTGAYKALRYEELIADLVATIQSQNKRIKMLEERLGV